VGGRRQQRHFCLGLSGNTDGPFFWGGQWKGEPSASPRVEGHGCARAILYMAGQRRLGEASRTVRRTAKRQKSAGAERRSGRREVRENRVAASIREVAGPLLLRPLATPLWD
jgi:hypothetical protein